MNQEKVLVAMSGGVDSSVAAALLVEQGFAVSGAYMKNWINEPGIAGDCPWQKDIEDARSAADSLGIPFRIVNLMDEYRNKVVNYLLEGYKSGITPNPDAMCNREIKFGAFLSWATANGFDKIATGHYARLALAPNGETELWEGSDKNKDQSYFLALLKQHQLEKALFPVGDLPKQQVRAIAEKYSLANAKKKDSQGICFIGQVKMRDFLRAYLPDSPGPVVDPTGKPIGTHRGLHLYTLGQRRGVGIASPFPNRAYVVVGKRHETNELVMALESDSAPGLYSQLCTVTGLSFPSQPPDLAKTLQVRPRYRAPAAPAAIREKNSDLWEVSFFSPQRALTPGQIAAFYDGEKLVAGGIVAEVQTLAPDSP